MDAVDLMRLSNVVLGSAILAWLGVRSWLRWFEYPAALQLFILSLSFYIFGVTLASIELLIQDVEHGPWSYAWLLANCAMLVTLGLTQKRRHFEVH